MRTWMSLVLVLAGVSVGCGDSDGKKNDDAGQTGATGEDNATNGDNNITGGDNTNTNGQMSTAGNNLPDAEVKDPYPKCDRTQTEKVIEGYTGDKPEFSMANLTACQMKCGQDDMCFVDANCPGLELWGDCVFENLLTCVGSEGKTCRWEVENYDCCVAASGCDLTSMDPTCVRSKCATDGMALSACLDTDIPCIQTARGQCFGAGYTPDPDGGVNPDASVPAGDGGVKKVSSAVRFLR